MKTIWRVRQNYFGDTENEVFCATKEIALRVAQEWHEATLHQEPDIGEAPLVFESPYEGDDDWFMACAWTKPDESGDKSFDYDYIVDAHIIIEE